MRLLNKQIILTLLAPLFLSVSLQSSSIITQYRHDGIKNIEKQMDLDLTNTAYWSYQLKNIDTSFGYLESYSSVLMCNKKNATLQLYKYNHKRNFSLIEKYNALIGKANGDKYREGDLKTPVGIYTLTRKISDVNPFYGPFALTTSYPNTFDRYRGKSGSGIWIHGFPPKEQKREKYTKGCIAINNDNMMCLDRDIDIQSTLLIINPSEKRHTVSKKVLASLLAGLYKWRYHWLYNETSEYLSFYSPDFVRNDGMGYKDFFNYKKRIFRKAERKQIIFNDINIVPYPNTSDIFQITFKEFYSSRSFRFEGNKVLIVKRNKKNNFQIITEK